MKEDRRSLDLETRSQDSVTVPMDKQCKQKHCPVYIVTIVLTCVTYAILMVLSYFGGDPDGVMIRNTYQNNSNHHYFEITPAGWAYTIWGVIYLYQIAWLIYALTTIFRATPQSRLYTVPTIPLGAFIIYITNTISVVVWLFSFDGRKLVVSFFSLLYGVLSLAFALGLCFWRQKQQIRFFNLIEQRYEMILLNIIVYNAWAVYLGWTICATVLNFGCILVYRAGFGQELSGSIVLAILLAIIVIGCSLELALLDRYMRYIVMHYLGPVMALLGSIYRQSTPNDVNDHEPSGLNRTFAFVILIILMLFIVAKFIALFIRAWKQPLYYKCKTESSDRYLEEEPSRF